MPLTLMSLRQSFSAYIRLMRLDKPTGILLVLFPCWWGLLIAQKHGIHWKLMLVFAVGTLLTRTAGCIINDLFDQEFDKQVARTKNRPLASGELSNKQAIIVLGIVFALAAPLLFFLPVGAIYIALASLVLMIIYPNMKRITFLPQVFLAFTINWGALVAWAAVGRGIGFPHVLSLGILYFGLIFWTLAYDTVYAHQDREDDEDAGVKSTALLLGDATKEYVQWFYKGAFTSIAIAGLGSSIHILFFFFLGIAAFMVFRNVEDLDFDNSESCAKHFKMQMTIGALITAGFIVGRLLY
ncbi:MAG: 4-hydroxybenzoate octaprenyltransferase [Alphaproteobacteria bacterium]|nr:4-hydroxybenzoate octaprenyltransferase [Alphaproteobacteria bacterium]